MPVKPGEVEEKGATRETCKDLELSSSVLLLHIYQTVDEEELQDVQKHPP